MCTCMLAYWLSAQTGRPWLTFYFLKGLILVRFWNELEYWSLKNDFLFKPFKPRISIHLLSLSPWTGSWGVWSLSQLTSGQGRIPPGQIRNTEYIKVKQSLPAAEKRRKIGLKSQRAKYTMCQIYCPQVQGSQPHTVSPLPAVKTHTLGHTGPFRIHSFSKICCMVEYSNLSCLHML